MASSDDLSIWMTDHGPKRLEQLTREELLGVVRQLGLELRQAREFHGVTLEAWGACRKLAASA